MNPANRFPAPLSLRARPLASKSKEQLVYSSRDRIGEGVSPRLTVAIRLLGRLDWEPSTGCSQVRTSEDFESKDRLQLRPAGPDHLSTPANTRERSQTSGSVETSV